MLGIVCPHCGETSDHIIATVSEIWEYPVEYEITDEGRRRKRTFWDGGERAGGDAELLDHMCPKCGEILTVEDEDEGIRKYIEEELEDEKRAELYAKLLNK